MHSRLGEIGESNPAEPMDFLIQRQDGLQIVLL
jgi:hypothetical protein